MLTLHSFIVLLPTHTHRQRNSPESALTRSSFWSEPCDLPAEERHTCESPLKGITKQRSGLTCQNTVMQMLVNYDMHIGKYLEHKEIVSEKRNAFAPSEHT